MASRIARTAFGSASRLRPTLPKTSLPSLACRSASNAPEPTPATNASVPTTSGAQDPKKAAQSILDSLPGSSLVSKTAILSGTFGAGLYALSNEYYVVNEETVVAFCLLSVFYAVGKYGGPAYKEWADGQSNKIKGILNAARADHTNAVKARIESVGQMGGVVDITKQLFAISKETAELEAKAYELEQTTAYAHEAKAVLDSWVRYEGQVKQRQQKELADSIIAKITKELENPKVLEKILSQSVADVERIIAAK